MSRRVCSVPGCPTLTDVGKCTTHRRQADRARGTRQDRGYDAEHDAERAAWVPKVAAGGVLCRRCRQPIAPYEPWDLGHPDDECPAPRAPEHRARCNRAAAGRAAHSA